MLILALLFTSLLNAQIEYRASSSQATLFTPSATPGCRLQASLSADMQNPVEALAAESDADTSTFTLSNLQPAQRYYVQLTCNGTLSDAAIITTEPDTASAPTPATACDTAPREITAPEEGGLLDLPVNPHCGQSLTRQSLWLHFEPHASRAQIIVEPNSGAARQTSVYIGSEKVLIRQTAATNCNFTLGSSWYAGTAGTYSMTVPAPAGCTWSVASTPAWVSLSGSSSGTGPGMFYYIVNANGNNTRTGTITLSGGQTFTLNQLPGACTGSGDNTSWFPFAGGSYTFDLVAPAGCTWTLSTYASWIRVTSALSGLGSATVSYTVDPNTGASRTGNLTANFPGGIVTRTIQQPIYVNNGPCTYSVMYSTEPAGAYATGFGITLNTQLGCPWTASSNSTWAVVPLTSGYGPTSVVVLLSSNVGAPSSRSAVITVAGYTITLTQSGLVCTSTIFSTGGTFPASGGTFYVWVDTPAGCPITTTSNTAWAQITNKPPSGSGYVSFLLPQNDGVTRTGTLTIGQYTYTLNQYGNTCTPVFIPAQSWFPNTAGLYTIHVTSAVPSCSWAVTSASPWVQIINGSGVGPNSFTISLQANPGPTRTGLLQFTTPSASPFTINQVAGTP